MNILKKMVTLLPGGATLARRFSSFGRGRRLAGIGNTEERFGDSRTACRHLDIDRTQRFPSRDRR